MRDSITKWNELKAKFLRDFLPGEQLFFLKKARECVSEKGYPVSEDLFNYCCSLTLRERLRLIQSQDGEGLMRFMLVESHREIESEVKILEKRLEERKRPIVIAGEEGRLLLEFLGR
ncbi:MAG: hypothetical protein HGB21_08485 [Nitrospirae bacterium]|nr:hypothetical protein [Nitrospirota bacterium]NTW66325.1 hypothetical protein [Nitrospirota bacterium]